jgi:hypothetical protein
MWAAQFPCRQPVHFVFPSEKYGAAGEEDSFGFTAGPVVYDTDPTRPDLLAIGRKLGRKPRNALAQFCAASWKKQSQNRSSAGSTILDTPQ